MGHSRIRDTVRFADVKQSAVRRDRRFGAREHEPHAADDARRSAIDLSE
jgi:hypothetical protein